MTTPIRSVLYRARRLPLLITLLLTLPLAGGCPHTPAQVALARALSEPGFWSCRCRAVSVATGRDAAGGGEVLWVAWDRGVDRITPDGRSETVWRAPALSQILRLESVDLDDDGVSEWLVLLDVGSVRTVMVAGVDGVRRRVGPPFSGFVRSVRGPDGADRLLGQRSGRDRVFLGPVRWLTREAGRWRQGDPVGLPDGIGIYAFFWLQDGVGGPARLFTVEASGHLAERPTAAPGRRIWVSGDALIGPPIRLIEDRSQAAGDGGLALPAAIQVGDLDGTVAGSALLATGSPGGPAIFNVVRIKSASVLRGGRLLRVDLAQPGLATGAATESTGRAMLGGTPWNPDGAGAVWAGVVWTRASAGLSRPGSRVLLFDPSTGRALARPPPANGAR